MSKPKSKVVLSRGGKTADKPTQPKPEQELIRTEGHEITSADVLNFIREVANGNPNDIEVVPLDNVATDGQFPFPFGNSGKTGGVRNQIQDMLAYGVNGDRRLAVFLMEASKLGHSRTRPVCLLAAMNGGYSPSSKYWGTPYVKLVYRPHALREKAA